MDTDLVNKYKEIFNTKILPVLEQKLKKEIKEIHGNFKADLVKEE